MAYLVAGVATTVVNYVVYFIATRMLGLGVMAGTWTAWVVAVAFAYVVNKLFVFRSHCPSMGALVKEALSFFSARGVTMLLEVGGMVLFGTILRWNPWLVKIGLNVLVLVLNYVFSKLLVFQKKK